MGPSAKPTLPANTLLLVLVGINIVLQLTSASLIKYAAGLGHAQVWALLGILSVVMALSLGRFAAWHAMHRRFPVSVAYPATALFFPCLVTLAWFLGEPVSLRQALGAVLVTLGVLMLIRTDADQEEITA
jgi:drug/metabolite transporter (DMT)-like permease